MADEEELDIDAIIAELNKLLATGKFRGNELYTNVRDLFVELKEDRTANALTCAGNVADYLKKKYALLGQEAVELSDNLYSNMAEFIKSFSTQERNLRAKIDIIDKVLQYVANSLKESPGIPIDDLEFLDRLGWAILNKLGKTEAHHQRSKLTNLRSALDKKYHGEIKAYLLSSDLVSDDDTWTAIVLTKDGKHGVCVPMLHHNFGPSKILECFECSNYHGYGELLLKHIKKLAKVKLDEAQGEWVPIEKGIISRGEEGGIIPNASQPLNVTTSPTVASSNSSSGQANGADALSLFEFYSELLVECDEKGMSNDQVMDFVARRGFTATILAEALSSSWGILRIEQGINGFVIPAFRRPMGRVPLSDYFDFDNYNGIDGLKLENIYGMAEVRFDTIKKEWVTISKGMIRVIPA